MSEHIQQNYSIHKEMSVRALRSSDIPTDLIESIIGVQTNDEVVVRGWDGSQGVRIELLLPLEVYEQHLDEKDGIQAKLECWLRNFFSYCEDCVGSVVLVPWDKVQNSAPPLKEDDLVSIWGEDYQGKTKVFISHSTKQKEVANRLKKRLDLYGFKCFVAHEDIKSSKEWREELKKGLRSMDTLLAWCTDDFCDSAWCQQEVGFAFGLGKPILSVPCCGGRVLGKLAFLADYQFDRPYQGKGYDDAAYELAVKLTQLNPGALHTMQKICAKLLRDSCSFAGAGYHAKRLQRIYKSYDPKVHQIIEAAKENLQVKCSFEAADSLTYFNSLVPNQSPTDAGVFDDDIPF